MGFISTIVFGVIVGVIAKIIMPGKNDPGGFVMTAILGILGSFVGTYLGSLLGMYQDGQWGGWIASIIGACILLFVYGKFFGTKTQG